MVVGVLTFYGKIGLGYQPLIPPPLAPAICVKVHTPSNPITLGTSQTVLVIIIAVDADQPGTSQTVQVNKRVDSI